MKYSTYVEPATYMLREGTMLWNQKRYVADPLKNPEGIFHSFDHLPLMEWGLYLLLRWFPGLGMEMTTRLLTHSIGVLTVLFAYLFFTRHFPKSFSLLFTGLLCINPVFSFSTYVTVLDSIAMLFMFLSLWRLSVSIDRGRVSGVIWAGIWFGLGNAVKYPLFLWLAPIGFLFLFWSESDTVSFLKDYFIYIATSLLVTFAVIYAVRIAIKAPVFAAAVLLSLAGSLCLAWFFLVRGAESVHRLFEVVWERKYILAGALAIAVVAGAAAWHFLHLSDFADQFFTDRRLIANPRLYRYMLLQQFKNYMTRNLFWPGVFGVALALATRERAMRVVAFPFLFGSIVYWVVASKPIFIHLYYALIIMITLTIFSAYFLYFLLKNIQAPLQKGIVIACLAAMIAPPVLDATNGRMQNYLNVDNVVKFIRENTRPDEFIMFQGFLTPISIYTQRGFVMPAVLAENGVRDDVRRLGFAETMRKYRIKYLFTPNEDIDYVDFAPLFERTELKEPTGQNFNRDILIYARLGLQDPKISRDLAAVDRIVEEDRIREKFVLAARLGRFRFYSFRN